MTRPVQCVEEHALGEVLALPESDPQRRHLDECPRCRALVTSYRQFLEPSREDQASYGTHEEERMNATRSKMFGVPAHAVGFAAGAHHGPKPPPEISELASPKRDWRHRLFGPTMRPVWGFAAVILAFGILRLAPRPQPEAPVLRGGASTQILLGTPQYLPDGSVTLSWPSHNEADRYELRFYSTALAELSRRDAGLDTMVTITPTNLPDVYQRGEPVLYRVVAIHGGDDLSTSAPGTIKRP